MLVHLLDPQQIDSTNEDDVERYDFITTRTMDATNHGKLTEGISLSGIETDIINLKELVWLGDEGDIIYMTGFSGTDKHGDITGTSNLDGYYLIESFGYTWDVQDGYSYQLTLERLPL